MVGGWFLLALVLAAGVVVCACEIRGRYCMYIHTYPCRVQVYIFLTSAEVILPRIVEPNVENRRGTQEV